VVVKTADVRDAGLNAVCDQPTAEEISRLTFTKLRDIRIHTQELRNRFARLLCPHCGKGFQPGSLAAKADAETKALSRKTYAIFLTAFLILPPVLFLIQGYLHRLP
jgi:hypothetical protein